MSRQLKISCNRDVMILEVERIGVHANGLLLACSQSCAFSKAVEFRLNGQTLPSILYSSVPQGQGECELECTLTVLLRRSLKNSL